MASPIASATMLYRVRLAFISRPSVRGEGIRPVRVPAKTHAGREV
jgi:hypothetical protein